MSQLLLKRRGHYDFPVGENQTISLGGLDGAETELENLKQLIPNTINLFDQDFNRNNTIPQMNNHSIIHFATHGYFVRSARFLMVKKS